MAIIGLRKVGSPPTPESPIPDASVIAGVAQDKMLWCYYGKWGWCIADSQGYKVASSFGKWKFSVSDAKAAIDRFITNKGKYIAQTNCEPVLKVKE